MLSKTEITEIFTPAIDNLINSWQFNPDLIDIEIYNRLTAIYNVISCIKPMGDDGIRKLWIGVHRGTINDFGEFEELKEKGDVETYEEFESLWKDYYPDEIKWYSFVTAKYQTELFFYFDSKLLFSIKEGEEPAKGKGRKNNEIYKFLDWLHYRLKHETEKLKQDTDSFNKYLESNLSFNKRFGRIKRKNFWNILGDKAIRLDKRLVAKSESSYFTLLQF